MVIMQHASFLYRQRWVFTPQDTNRSAQSINILFSTLRGLRSTIKTTTASASSWCTISSTQVRTSFNFVLEIVVEEPKLKFQTLWNTTVPHTLLPSRSKKSSKRSVCSDMSSLFKARNVGHRPVRLGSSDRWVCKMIKSWVCRSCGRKNLNFLLLRQQ